jgi:hypothetical protein
MKLGQLHPVAIPKDMLRDHGSVVWMSSMNFNITLRVCYAIAIKILGKYSLEIKTYLLESK